MYQITTHSQKENRNAHRNPGGWKSGLGLSAGLGKCPAFTTPVTLTPQRFGSVRAAYIATLADMAVSTPLQLTMIGRGQIDEVIPLPTGHSPHNVAADDLVTALIAASTPELE